MMRATLPKTTGLLAASGLMALCVVVHGGRHGRCVRLAAHANQDLGEPLLLSPYIADKRLKEGRAASAVHLPGMRPSHAGFMTIDETAGSNLYFWCAHTNPRAHACMHAPALVRRRARVHARAGLFTGRLFAGLAVRLEMTPSARNPTPTSDGGAGGGSGHASTATNSSYPCAPPGTSKPWAHAPKSPPRNARSPSP